MSLSLIDISKNIFILQLPQVHLILYRSSLIVCYSRYRHYGVYVTHEEDQLVDGDDVLRNPVVVLDKNSESYINLKYPIHSKDDTELTKSLNGGSATVPQKC